MFKGLGNVASLLKQAQQMGGKMQALNGELRAKRATGSAGAGLVTVEVNGLGEMVRITIDPDLIARGETEMIETLIPAAANQAQSKAKQFHAEAVQGFAGGMELPGLEEALASVTGTEPTDESSHDATD